MSFAAKATLFSSSLFFGILLMIAVGRRIGMTGIKEDIEARTKGSASVETAVFGLLGLILAFLFSGALARFDDRRHLVIEEANDIGTAWLRVDLLPPDAQPPMRELFRKYLDRRIAVYHLMPDLDASDAESKKAALVQAEIWKLAVSATRSQDTAYPPMLLLPALNAMFDIATTRAEAVRVHPPSVITAMLAILTLACSLFAGFGMANLPRWDPLHSIVFAAVFSVTVYVIVDLEYPRLGLIQMTDSDEVLVSLRASMNP